MEYIKIFFLCFFLAGCGEYNEKALKQTPTEKIVYSASFKYASYDIVASRFFENNKMRYVFKLTSDGRIMTVFKNRLVALDDVSGVSKYLVSDTSNNKIFGPNLFGHSIEGYYFKVIKYDSVEHIVKKISPSEISYFHSIDSLMKKNDIDLIPLDSVEKLYWFEYKFDN
jgi:hypothetical protein